MPKTHAVLVTGAAGRIGRAVCAELLARGHRVRGLDRVPSPGLRDAVVGDVANPDDLARAVAGMDTVVHLAATPDEADFLTSLLPNNVVGLYHVLEAARTARLARVVLVSSGQLYRGHAGPLPITPATPTSPRNWYALTKVLTEAAGQVYAHAHGLGVVVVRPGWVPRDPAHAAELAASAHGKDSYLSPGDAGRGFAAAVEAKGLPRYTVVHVTSRPLGAPRYDLGPARALLGYEPRDQWPEGLGFAPDPGVAGAASVQGRTP
jgi:nucleoside-diphosphate-sugar epimerase